MYAHSSKFPAPNGNEQSCEVKLSDSHGTTTSTIVEQGIIKAEGVYHTTIGMLMATVTNLLVMSVRLSTVKITLCYYWHANDNK